MRSKVFGMIGADRIAFLGYNMPIRPPTLSRSMWIGIASFRRPTVRPMRSPYGSHSWAGGHVGFFAIPFLS